MFVIVVCIYNPAPSDTPRAGDALEAYIIICLYGIFHYTIVCLCMYMCVYMCIHIYIYVYMYIYIYIYTHTYLCVYIYIYVYICIHIYIYIYIYTQRKVCRRRAGGRAELARQALLVAGMYVTLLI